jgi:hypothetical protein
MNDGVIPMLALLQRSEGDALDFKRENYPFSGGTDEEKSELLKDILCLSNARKETDAYIIIGVEEKYGRAVSIGGVTPTLNDNDVQQFVNTKTNRPVSFGVEHVRHDDKLLTVIRVNRDQTRPIFLRRGYGRLKGNVVYVRHGSSSDEASPDEISEMVRADMERSNQPDVLLTFGISKDYWRYGDDDATPAVMRREPYYVDSFDVVAINRGKALAQYIQGAVTVPRGLLLNYFREIPNPMSIAGIRETKPVTLKFSNHLREPTANYFLKAYPLEWKPLLPGMRLHLLREKAVPLREKVKDLNIELPWELAVDNCEYKKGVTNSSDVVVTDGRAK